MSDREAAIRSYFTRRGVPLYYAAAAVTGVWPRTLEVDTISDYFQNVIQWHVREENEHGD